MLGTRLNKVHARLDRFPPMEIVYLDLFDRFWSRRAPPVVRIDDHLTGPPISDQIHTIIVHEIREKHNGRWTIFRVQLELNFETRMWTRLSSRYNLFDENPVNTVEQEYANGDACHRVVSPH
jgi:hypothetical protein